MKARNKHERDVESVALWLHWMACSTGQTEVLGQLIRAGVGEANELYGPPSDTDDNMPTLVRRFADKWDELEGLVRRDSESEPSPGLINSPVVEQRPEAPIHVRTETDQWGFARGSQAAEINEILMGPDYRSINEIFEQVTTKFPTITRARVNSHINVLRSRYRPFLHEHREGRNVSFRLVVQPPPTDS